MKSLRALRRLIDRMTSPISVEEYNQVIGQQNAMVDNLTADRAAVRGIMLRTMAVHPACYDSENHRDPVRLAEKIEQFYQKQVAAAIEAQNKLANLQAELAGARRHCDRLQERCDALEQGNAKLSATMEELEGERDKAIEDCGRQARALNASEHARQTNARAYNDASVNLHDLRRRIANAADALSGPREFPATQPVDMTPFAELIDA